MKWKNKPKLIGTPKKKNKFFMLIRVKTFPNSKKEEVIEKSKNSFEVKVKEKPLGGKATKAVLRTVSLFLKIPISKIRIKKGFKQRSKILEIME